MKKELFEILVEDVDENVLNKMPEWFRTLRKTYRLKQRLSR